MQNINKLALLLSFILLALLCSALSISAAPENARWTLESMNPWNGVEGVAFTIGYFLNMGGWVVYTITVGLLLVIWWRLYTLISKLLRIGRKE